MSSVDRLSDLVVDRPEVVVLWFFLATAVFAGGVPLIETETGLDQFTDDVPEADAMERVAYEFDEGAQTTQLLQSDRDVLSRDGLLRILEAEKRLHRMESMRVRDSESPARMVAQVLDPTADGLDEEIFAVERATDAEIALAVEVADERSPRFSRLLGVDYSRERASSTAAVAQVRHDVPVDDEEHPALTSIQLAAENAVEPVQGVWVFGQGLSLHEFDRIIEDSLMIVVPASVFVIFVLLVAAYRDPFDFLLALAALAMTMVWTFGFMGYVGIPFDQMLIAVPPLLVAIGVDFGIHSVNRYREERVKDVGYGDSMTVMLRQLLVAFTVIAITTVIGLGSNVTSGLTPVRQFGVVASAGLVFTLLIFGVFMPAAKLYLDRWRSEMELPEFASTPLGAEDSSLGEVLARCRGPALRAPTATVVLVLLLTLMAGFYGAGVDTEFDEGDFLPPDPQPRYVEFFPGFMQPGDYSVTGSVEFVQENFEAFEEDTVTVYIRGPLAADGALTSIQRAGMDPPETFVAEDRIAASDSILSVIEGYSDVNPRYRLTVEARDLSGDGVPEYDLEPVYAGVLESGEVGDDARMFVSDDLRSTRVIYPVDPGAELGAVKRDAEVVADRHRFDAQATGQLVLYQSVAEMVLETASRSLSTAFFLTLLFLMSFYRWTEGSALLGVVNISPVVIAAALLVATMRAAGVPFNALTATILAISVGIGIDYSVHVTHRFVDEYHVTDDVERSLLKTLRGTGGALTATMLTTAAGTGVLVLAVTPMLGQFGALTALSIFYAYVLSLLVLPAGLVLWVRYVDR